MGSRDFFTSEELFRRAIPRVGVSAQRPEWHAAMDDIQCRQGECPEIVELPFVAAVWFGRMPGLGSRVVIEHPLEEGSQFRRCGRRDANRACLLRSDEGGKINVAEAASSAVTSDFREGSRDALLGV
jgi:hypothetical protein